MSLFVFLGSWYRFFCALLLGLMTAPSVTSAAPNILLVVADDLGYEKLGCYGGINTSTPVLDDMAKKGAMFTRAYASPVCTPTRMSLYTGTYMPRHRFSDVMPIHTGSTESVDLEQWHFLSRNLQKAGYDTSVTGKWQLAGLEAHPDHCLNAGFNSWCVWQIWRNGAKTTRYWNATLNQDGKVREDIKDRFGPDVLTDYVIERMTAAKQKGVPFFIHHNMMLPHYPVTPTPAEKASRKPASHDAMIAYMDGQVGRLMQAISDLGIEENTIVIFAGDNGTQSNTPRQTEAGEVTGGKWQLNDAGTHVPLIAVAPGRISAGLRLDALVDIADVYPTLCELAGVSLTEQTPIDGLSFAGPLTGTGPGQRTYVTAGIGNNFFVFDGCWRLQHQGETLIDCRKLPVETPAVAGDPAAEAARARLLPILNELRAMWKTR